MIHPDSLYPRLAELLPKSSLEPTVVDFLDHHPDETLFVACSGGSDSLCLLLLTRLYWPKNPCIVLHYNHKMRSVSDAEAIHMQDVAKQLNLPIEIGTRTLTSETKFNEQQLRELRYSYFSNVLDKHKGHFLLLGHHRDDLIETFFMRLVRGSSIDGLIAPKPIQAFANGHIRLRPLLTLSKDQIKQTCHTLDLPFVEDASNTQTDILRNRIRHVLVPTMQQVFGVNKWQSGVQKTCRLLLEQQHDWEALYRQYSQGIDIKNDTIAIQVILAMPDSLQRKFITTWLNNFKIKSITFDIVEKIKTALCSSSKPCYISVDKTHRICIVDEFIRIQATPLQTIPYTPRLMPLATDSKIYYPNNACLTRTSEILSSHEKEKIFQGKYSDEHYAYLDASKVDKLYVRAWAPGDRYHPIHFHCEKKVKNLFVERKINYSTKYQRPVICNQNDQIVWIPGLPIAHPFRIEPQTNSSVLLTYRYEKLI